MRLACAAGVAMLSAVTTTTAAQAPEASRPGPSTPPNGESLRAGTLVMPFENAQNEPRLFWLGEGSAILLADYFETFGAATISREARVGAFDKLQLPRSTGLSHATVVKVAQFVGASEVIVGSYALAGEQLTVRARAIRLDTGRLLPEVTERGPLTELFALYERVARRLRDATIATAAIAAGTVLATPAALEIYVKGLIAETAPMRRSYLEQALKLAPTDERVRLALWEVFTDLGDHLKALDAVSGVSAASHHSRDARYFAALSQIDLKRYDAAFGALEALQGETRAAEVLNAMGVVQVLRGSTPQTGTPAYYFNQAAELDPADPDYFFNLGYAYWLDRDPPAAVYWLREAVRRDPADGDAHYVLGSALQPTGAEAEAAREKELARRLSSSYAEWDARAAKGEEAVPRGLERLKERLATRSLDVASSLPASGPAFAEATAGRPASAEWHLEAGRRAFDREADREAEQQLRRALFLSPYLAEAHVLLGRVYLRAHRTAEAVQALKIALWSEESTAAHIALAEAYLQLGDVASARAEADRALVMDPASSEAKALRERLKNW